MKRKSQERTVRQRPFRRMKTFVLSPEEFAVQLRLLYLRHISFYESMAAVARRAGLPFETLRRFCKDKQDKVKLCPVNEEKLARALGHDAPFFHRLVERFHRFQQRRRRLMSARPSGQVAGRVQGLN